MMNILFKAILLIILLLLTVFLIDRFFGIEISYPHQLTELISMDDEEDDEEGDNDEDGDEENDNNITIIDGHKAIQVQQDIIDSAGIKYDKLYTINYKPEFSAFADVVDISPIVELNTKYQGLLARKKVSDTELNSNNKILNRALALHKNKSLSTGELEKIQAKRDKISAESSRLSIDIESFKLEVLSSLGENLAQLIFNEEKNQLLNDLASRKTYLVLLSLLKDQTLDPENQDVFININNERDNATLVDYYGKANMLANPLYGESFYYLIKSERLRVGMRIFAWVEKYTDTVSGLFIPESAVVWYGNEPWIYQKGSDDYFIRKPISDLERIPNGWLERKNQFNDAEIVISGSQTLMSEEFKWAIPDEDDD